MVRLGEKTIDVHAFPGAHGLQNAESHQGRIEQLVPWDRGGFPFQNRLHKPPNLLFLALVLGKKLVPSFPAADLKGQLPEIVEHGGAAMGVQLDSFFGKGPVPVGEIADGADRSVLIRQGNDDCVFLVLRVVHACSMDLDGQAPGEEREEIHEVASLPDDSSPACLWILDPGIVGNGTGIDAAEHGHGTVFNLPLDRLDQR